MTDSEKLDLILNKVTGFDERFARIDERLAGLDEKFTVFDQRVSNIEKDVIDIKGDLRHLHRNAEFILDEVERVHAILDQHKADKTVHTA